MRRMLATLLACTLLPFAASAAVPTSITVQGKLTDAGGVPLPAGAKAFVFRIYDDSLAGSKVWPDNAGENQTLTTTTDGLWVGFIGAVEPLTQSVFSASARWLEIVVDGTILPRTRLASGPYAFRVATVDGASGGLISSSTSIGTSNDINGPLSIASGSQNTASGWNTAAIGGTDNDATNDGAAVLGGTNNQAIGNNAVIAGGNGNSASSQSFVGAGESNRAIGQNAAVIGGSSDTAGAFRSAIVGGSGNSITSLGASSTILGGELNRITQELSVIGNGEANTITNVYSVIGGGQGNTVSGPWSVIDGGSNNLATSQGSGVGGGSNNRAYGFYATIGGGGGQVLSDSNHAGGTQSTIGGGRRNVTTGDITTIAGGDGNRAMGGGTFVGGGTGNWATGLNAAVAGGAGDTANGTHSMIPGGLGNRASGAYSFAAGRRAKAQHDGSFVFADDQNADFATTSQRQFLIRANAVGINTNAPEKALHVIGSAKLRDTLFVETITSPVALNLQTAGATRLHIDGTNGNVSINGGVPPASRLEVGGVIHSLTGGVKYPDGRTQRIGGLLAFGHIASNGDVHATSGNISCSYDAVNTRYLITISGESYAPLSYATNVTCDGSNSAVIPMISNFGSQLVVTMFDPVGNKVQNAFQFVTYKH